MSKIIDDLGYRIKIPKEELLAITLVDNGCLLYTSDAADE